MIFATGWKLFKRSFPQALIVGARGERYKTLNSEASGLGEVHLLDCAQNALGNTHTRVVAYEEALPLGDELYDLVVSVLSLHNANDFVGALAQYRRALKADGLFVGAVFAEGTLSAMRHALIAAETETSGGAANRFAPFAAVQDSVRQWQKQDLRCPSSISTWLKFAIQTR